ncbi:MAG TPA: tetraacyldisaccharide 4'-kinase, partial [Ignavibacteriaceae bacterium]|nr:tetraacyldisaccharide 4'-kinase [Ignavibacteriaceae bacterium]
MKLLKIFLAPLVPVYAIIVYIRNLFFDKSVFKSEKVNAKVISIGNINVGGSGKTPLVIYVTNILKSAGYKVGVLSRGYGRKSHGYKLVSKGDEILTTVQECGDEIYHTVLECKVPAAVSENRVNGARKLIEETGIDAIVLDDAFQHRWITRDIDLVIIDQSFINTKSFFTHNLLPSGDLREGFDSLKRSDAIILNRKFLDKEEIVTEMQSYLEGKKIFTAYYKAICFVDAIRKIEYNLDDFKGQDSLVVSGIANPKSFLSILNKVHVNTQNKLIFRDHKNYTAKEVQLIRKQFYTTNSHSIVTTEKDAVKLSRFKREFDDTEIFYLKINLCMDDEESFK